MKTHKQFHVKDRKESGGGGRTTENKLQKVEIMIIVLDFLEGIESVGVSLTVLIGTISSSLRMIFHSKRGETYGHKGVVYALPKE